MRISIQRREFIVALAGAAATWPLAARAQQGDRMRRVGVLSGFPADDPEMVARMATFRQAMQEQGWSEGRNLQIDYRSAGADAARIKFYAAELVGAPPDVILAMLQAWRGRVAISRASPGLSFRSEKSGSVFSRDWHRTSHG